MKKNIIFIFIFILVVMSFCGYFCDEYPFICVSSAYFCGTVASLTQKSEIFDYMKKKLN